MTIDATNIATAAAKTAARRNRSKPVTRSPNFDGTTFQRVYRENWGDEELLVRAQREHEMFTASPATKHWLASHHMVMAKNMMWSCMEHSPTMSEEGMRECKAWCQGVASWPDSMCNRLFPAFSGIEALGIDTTRQYRTEFVRKLAIFNKAICSIDQKTATLGGTAKWEIRWREYKGEITEFYYDEWLPFVNDLCEATGANEYGFVVW